MRDRAAAIVFDLDSPQPDVVRHRHDRRQRSVWFYWPMLGTGIGVAITGIVLLRIGGHFGADWERREIDKYLRRRGN